MVEKEMAALTGVDVAARGERGREQRMAWRPVLPKNQSRATNARLASARASQWATDAVSEVTEAALAGGADFAVVARILSESSQQLIDRGADAESERLVREVAARCRACAELGHLEPSDARETVAAMFTDLGLDFGDAAPGSNSGVATARTAAWIDRARSSVQKGARAAHRWTQVPEPWRPPPSDRVAGVETARPQALVEERAESFGSLWEAEATPAASALPPVEERKALGAVLPEAIRAAARTFSLGSACGVDGLRPSHFQWLSDESLEILGMLWAAMELAQLVPPQWQHLRMPLIPKKGGKLRAIGIFPASVRLWGKVRRAECDEWEAANPRPYFAAGAGRSPLSPVWRAGVLAEHGTTEGDAAASVPADIGTFFDRMPHEALRGAAREWGFPASLLEVALQLYGGARYVELGRAVGPATYARRGVIAGCSLCATLAKLILLGPLDSLQRSHSEIALDVFVDDVRLGVLGPPDHVVERLVDAFGDLDTALESTGVPLAPAKTAVAASSPALARRLQRVLNLPTPAGMSGAGVGEFLGVDFAPGVARRAWVRQSRRRARFRGALARVRRLAVLRRAAGPRARLVSVAGVLPQATYATEVTGVTGPEILQLRRIAATGIGGRAGGRSTARLLLLEGDPTAAAVVAPAARWAQEAWASSTGDTTATPMGRLVEAHANLKAKPPRRWGQARGPGGAAWLTLERLGWTWPRAWEFATRSGEVINLSTASPKLVQRLLAEETRAGLEREATAALLRRGIANPAVGIADNDGPLGPAGSSSERVTFAPVRRVLRSSDLDAAQKGCLRAAVSGALWTRRRMADAGYDVDAACPLCQSGADDTLWHRMWECEASADLRRGQEALTRRALAAGPGSALYSLGLAPHPNNDVEVLGPSSSDLAVHEGWAEGLPAIFEPGPVYVDGSCAPAVVPEMARASWAVVQVGADGLVSRSIAGVVPACLPQSAPAAEHCALVAAAAATTAENRIIGDCQMVVDGARLGFAPRRWGRLTFGGALRTAHGNAAARPAVAHMEKVKAHQTLDGLEGAEMVAAVGNTAADETAKNALLRHPQQTPATTRRLTTVVEDALASARLVGRASSRWPRARTLGEGRATQRAGPAAETQEQRRQELRRRRRERAAAAEVHRRAAVTSHDWICCCGTNRCRVCLVRRCRVPTACAGAPARLSARVAASRRRPVAAIVCVWRMRFVQQGLVVRPMASPWSLVRVVVLGRPQANHPC